MPWLQRNHFVEKKSRKFLNNFTKSATAKRIASLTSWLIRFRRTYRLLDSRTFPFKCFRFGNDFKMFTRFFRDVLALEVLPFTKENVICNSLRVKKIILLSIY